MRLPVSVDMEMSAQIEIPSPAKPPLNVQSLPPAAPIISPGFECPICLEKHKDVSLGFALRTRPIITSPRFFRSPVAFSPLITFDLSFAHRRLTFAQNLVSTICGHIFCKPCLKESMKTVKQCPKCRKRINAKSFHSIFI